QLEAGPYPVRVAVGNRFGERVQEWVVSLRGPNQLPEFLSSPLANAKANKLYRTRLETGDPDGTPVVLSLQAAPSGASMTADGRLEWLPRAAGIETFRVRASDEYGYVDLQWYVDV